METKKPTTALYQLSKTFPATLYALVTYATLSYAVDITHRTDRLKFQEFKFLKRFVCTVRSSVKTLSSSK